VSEPEKPSLFDDPGFLARLDELDDGVIGPGDARSESSERTKPPKARNGRPPLTLQRQRFSPDPDTTDEAVRLRPAERINPIDQSPARRAEAPSSVDLGELDDGVDWPAPPSASPVRDTPETADGPERTFSDALTYESFYGLDEKPFSLSSDPRFFYFSSSHESVAEHLLAAIQRREGISVLTGEIGTGKTTVCRAMAEKLDRRTLMSFLVDPLLTVDDLLKDLLIDFGVISRQDLARGRLSQATRHDLRSLLRDFLKSLSSLRACAVLILDEAHKLSVDVLEQVRVLADVDTADHVLQVVLVGEPRLGGTLKRPELRQLAQRISVRCELQPLTADEVAGYIAHRLSVAGRNPRVEFARRAISRVYELSSGVPRLINLLCDRALAMGCSSGAAVIGRDLVDAAAQDLQMEPAGGAKWASLRVVGIAALVTILLTLIGAGTAAFVLRDRFQSAITAWEAIPPLPQSPPVHEPPSIAPLPVPPETALAPNSGASMPAETGNRLHGPALIGPPAVPVETDPAPNSGVSTPAETGNRPES
jgi:type II secretory pathway predicted ATPase ExeA